MSSPPDAVGIEQPDPENPEFVCVLSRADFRVVDREAVLAAAREAMSASENTQPLDTLTLGSALYNIAHLRGMDSLRETPGLEPLAALDLFLDPVVDDAEVESSDEGEDAEDDLDDVPDEVLSLLVPGELLFVSEHTWSDETIL